LQISTETVTCPYCWQPFEISVDLSVEEQQYVEDCFVCCRPVVVRYRSDRRSVIELGVERENE
jgi:hypothetical protein